MVFVNLKITVYLYSKIHVSMTGNLFKHVIEKTNSGINTTFPGSIKIEFDQYVSLGRFTVHFSNSWYLFKILIYIVPVSGSQFSVGDILITDKYGFTSQVLCKFNVCRPVSDNIR